MNNRPAYEALMKFYPLTVEDLPDELWLPVPDFDKYQVSNFGRVKSFKFGKQLILKPKFVPNGYLQVSLWKDGKENHFYIHRLVAQLFITNPDSKPQINHRDGHKSNNFVGNLEWVTQSENQRHAVDLGLNPKGEGNGQAKLTTEQAQYIRNNPDNLTVKELSRRFNVHANTIRRIQTGKRWKQMGGTVRKSRPQKYTPRIPDDIREQIRAEYVRDSREFGSVALAKKYNVTPAIICKIVKNS